MLNWRDFGVFMRFLVIAALEIFAFSLPVSASDFKTRGADHFYTARAGRLSNVKITRTVDDEGRVSTQYSAAEVELVDPEGKFSGRMRLDCTSDRPGWLSDISGKISVSDKKKGDFEVYTREYETGACHNMIACLRANRDLPLPFTLRFYQLPRFRSRVNSFRPSNDVEIFFQNGCMSAPRAYFYRRRT